MEGGKLLDDFYAPEFGWSKDTTRYLLAALFAAGVIKLRIGGADVTVRGDSAVEVLRNNNSFKESRRRVARLPRQFHRRPRFWPPIGCCN